MTKDFRAGVIGVGFIGAAHIEQLRRLGNVEKAAPVSKLRIALSKALWKTSSSA